MGKGQANTGHMQRMVGGSGLQHGGGGAAGVSGPTGHVEECLPGVW